MVQPADLGPRHDTTGAGRLDGACLGRVLAEREVRSRALLIRDVRSKHLSEMPLVEDDHVVQTLEADGPDDAFDVGILRYRQPISPPGPDQRSCQCFPDGGARRSAMALVVPIIASRLR